MELTQGTSRDISWEGGDRETQESSWPWAKVGFHHPKEAAAEPAVQREMLGVGGQQRPLSSTNITELLLCARPRARGWTGAQALGSSPALLPAGSIVTAESLPSLVSSSSVMKWAGRGGLD